MKRSIIFSQAPAKIVAVLNCYEHELSEGREITIVVRTNLKGLYQFYKELGLKANIQMIEDRGSSGLYFWKNKKQNKELACLLGLNRIDDVRIFFTDIYDFGMGVLMPILIPFNPIHILSPVDVTDGENYEERQRGLPFINKCKGIILQHDKDSYSILDNQVKNILLNSPETTFSFKKSTTLINSSGKNGNIFHLTNIATHITHLHSYLPILP